MAANNIYIQIDVNSQGAQQNVNALNQSLAQTGPTTEKSSKQASTGLNTIGISVQNVNKEFGQLTNTLAGLGIAKAVAGMVQLAAEMSRAERAQAAFAGSAEKANEIFEQVRAIAAHSPFNFDPLEKAAQQMLVLGFAAKDVPFALKAISDQVARMGGEMKDVDTIVSLFGRILQKDFVSAMDLLRKLPAEGVPVIKALGAELEKIKGRPFDSTQVKEAIKSGVLDPLQTVNLMLKAMASKGDADQFSNDAARAFKNLGDTIRETAAKFFGPEGFGPALEKLAGHIERLLAPLGGLIDYLMKLNPETKEMIVNWTAGAIAFAAFGTALGIVTKLAGPLMGLVGSMWKFTGALAVMNPELTITVVLLGGLAFALYKLVPAFKANVDNLAGNAMDKLKAAVGALAEAGKQFLPPELKTPAPPEAGNLVRNEEQFKTLRDEMQKTADTAQATLLQALASPAEAIDMKYSTLFRELNKKIESELMDPLQASVLTAILQGGKVAEKAGAEFKETRRQLDEIARYQVERTKASADIQAAYLEAQDAQDLRSKVRVIDRVAQIRAVAALRISQIEKDNLQDQYNRFEAMAKQYRTQFEAAGVDVDGMLLEHHTELMRRQAMIDQKAIDDGQKARLDAWKKANDAIIEDQRRVYDALKGQFSELFDVFTDKTRSLGAALGDFFKKMVVGEARELFSNAMAGAATQAAGYGRPEESIARGGSGILGILLRKGMPPRPPLPPPAQEGVGTAVSGLVPPVVSTLQNTADRNEITASLNASAASVFANAVNTFAAAGGGATVSSKGSAGRSMEDAGGDSMSAAFQTASQTTGVPLPLLRAVAQAESNMNPLAVSNKGAMGLMQLMPRTAAGRGVTDPFNVEQNVMGGAKELQWLLRRYGGDQSQALAAYNYGVGNYDRAMASGRALPRETQNYVARISRIMATAAPDVAKAAEASTSSVTVANLANLPMMGTGLAAGAYLPDYGTALGGHPSSWRPPDSVTTASVAELASLPQGASALSRMSPLLRLGLAGALGAGGQQSALAKLGLPTPKQLGGFLGIGKGITGMATSPAVGMLATLGGMALASKGLQQHYAPAAVAGGGLAGMGYVMTNPAIISRIGLGAGLASGAAVGAGLGLFASGFQRGGGAGLAMDIGGGALAGAGIGTMIMPGVGTLVGAAIGAAAGAVTGIVRLFVHTEQERIRTGIKQVYGIDLTNRQILTQIQTIVDQKYGGNVDIGIRSQDVQDIVRLYALTTGQAANLPRPMYAATIAQSQAGGLATQPVYQGGVLVKNPYTGPTTYQYQTAVTQAQGLMASHAPGAGGGASAIFMQLNPQQANDLFTGKVVQAVQQNPSAIASANASATRSGDSRVSQASNMLEPLTSLG